LGHIFFAVFSFQNNNIKPMSIFEMHVVHCTGHFESSCYSLLQVIIDCYFCRHTDRSLYLKKIFQVSEVDWTHDLLCTRREDLP
jgi:hypothetical protein